MESWKNQLRRAIRTPDALAKRIALTPDEESFFSRGEGLPLLVTPHYLSLMTDDPADPIRRQAIPRAEEFFISADEVSDPLSEADFRPASRLVHRYPDRVLFLACGICATYCRHCFRRSFTSTKAGAATPAEVESAVLYIAAHPEVKELLVSGGDPLMLDDALLFPLLERFRSVRPDLVIRVATRFPVVLPHRFTKAFTQKLARLRPLFIITHFNHPAELSPESLQALDRLSCSGLTVLNQSVLLRGVNDNPVVLADLSHGLVAAGAVPYYLFLGDMAQGTSHLRVGLEEGRRIYRELSRMVSGLALPFFAVDLPGGGGKVMLSDSPQVGEDESGFYFENREGRVFRYPRESASLLNPEKTSQDDDTPPIE